MVPARVLSTRNGDPVAKAFGIPTLKEETSTNFSIGLSMRPVQNLAITADAYMINIADRIVLSSRFSTTNPMIGADVADILSPFANEGVSQAQFFLNAVDTRTRGLDLVAVYSRLCLDIQS